MSEPIFTYDFDDFPEAQRNVFFDLTLNLNNNSNIMQEIKNHSTVAFIMETPHDFIDVKFVEEYNIRKIYKFTSKECDFRNAVVDRYLREQFPKEFSGFYLIRKNDKWVWTPADNVRDNVDVDKRYWGYTILPYQGKISKKLNQRKELRKSLTKRYNEEYTVYIALKNNL